MTRGRQWIRRTVRSVTACWRSPPPRLCCESRCAYPHRVVRARIRSVSVQLRRWSRQEYDRMIDAGVLTPDDRVELIDGEIVTVTPQKSRHATAVRLTETALRRVF